MKLFTISTFLVVCFATMAIAETDPYWKGLEQAREEGLPQTAIECLNKIMAEAKQKKHYGEWVRALSEKVSLEGTIQGNHPEEKIRRLKLEFVNADSATRPMLQAVLAQWYWHYYERNRWRFNQRTQTQDMNDTDFTTWDLRKLFNQIDFLYQDLLQQRDVLTSIPVSSFGDFLERGNTPEDYRPTLYDFLAQQAINFYSIAEQIAARPEDAYEIDATSDALARADNFIVFQPATTDTASVKYKNLRLFQSLMGYHARTGNTLALIDVDIQRLVYVKNNSFGPLRNRILIKRMGEIAYRYRKYSQSSLALYYAARTYGEDGDLANAYVLASQGQKRFPKSQGGQWCSAYMTELTQKSLRLIGELTLPPGRGAITVSYKNFTKLFFRIYRDEWDGFLKWPNVNPYEYPFHPDGRLSLLSKPALAEWSVDLDKTTDLTERSVELPLPELQPGFYRIFASWQPDFQQSSMLQDTWFWVSTMALMERVVAGRAQGLVLDDRSGEPRQGVSVTAVQRIDHQTKKYDHWWFRFNKKYKHRYHYNSWYEYKFGTRRTSTKDGFADFGKARKQFMLLATTDRDTLLDAEKIQGESRGRDPVYSQAVLFTDRSLYRPGQTIHYKGICISGDWAANDYQVQANSEVVVEFYDANNKVIAADTVQSNDFGSFSGTFTAPSDRLTGRMRLQTAGLYARADFRVEEYKRPKFQVELKNPQSALRLNDVAKVKGSAMLYNGSSLDHALVRYRIKRGVRYPYWWTWLHWQQPSSGEQEIAHGTVRTDATGSFEIAFPAVPDPMIASDADPTFTYAISADVTAEDGETRTANTTIILGYKALAAKLCADSTLQDLTVFPLTVSTTTLGGENLPASGTVRIVRLRQPPQPVRAKVWEFSYCWPSITNFIDTASFGSKWAAWPADTTVAMLDFATIKSNPETLCLQLPTGLYRAECLTRDSFGSVVKALLPLMVLPDPRVQSFGIRLPSTAMLSSTTIAVGGNLEVRWGTGYNQGRCLVEILHDNEIVKRYWTEPSVTQHVFTVPVPEQYRGGFLVHLTAVHDNRAYQHEYRIDVPWDNKDISISLESFRSKLQPGECDTIMLRVKGRKRPLETAEVLAAMYDQSLDQFYGHGWPSLNIFKCDRSTIKSSFINHAQQFTVIREHYFWNDHYQYNPITYTTFPGSVTDNLFYYQFNTRPSRFVGSVVTEQSSGTTGKITGTVVDAETKEPLPGAVVTILGTTLGANTDLDGRFMIVNVPIGTYSVQAKMMGYQTSTSTNVKSILNLTTTIAFKLTVQTLASGKEITITARRVMVEPSATAKTTIMNTSDIMSLPGGNATSAIGQTAGIVVRGGRSDEMAYFVDNVSVNDPLRGILGAAGVNGGSIDVQGISIRKNLSETAFFYPHLLMDDSGRVRIEATMPEALTRWRFMALAHGKELQSGFASALAVTQKRLMVQPNLPRFLREGDTIEFTAKVINLTDTVQTGLVQLDLKDLATGQPRDSTLKLTRKTQQFILAAKTSQGFSWHLEVPKGMGPLAYTLAAKSENCSDGEEGGIPVLSSRVFLTESVPLWISKAGTKTFLFDRLKQIGTSPTFDPQRLTVQMASNPAWYAIQALPYLIEFPYECSEQIFSRYYANGLAGYIANSSPAIRKVFDQWKGTEALKSNLEKNQSLKSVVLEETPWVLQAEDETAAKNRVGRLFETSVLDRGRSRAYDKLQEMQMGSGAWPWFPGGQDNFYITLYIATGFARLRHLNVPVDLSLALHSLDYLDHEIKRIYDHLICYDCNNLDPSICLYLYCRSFYLIDKPIPGDCRVAVNYYLAQADEYWLQVNSRMNQGQLALAADRWDKKDLAMKIMASIKQRSVTDEELGRFWREDELSWWWHRAPIETQAMMIEAFDEVTQDTTAVEECKVWLLKQKQTQDWKTTTATTNAIYALLLRGENLLSSTKLVDVSLGDVLVKPDKAEAGTGFYEKVYSGDQVKPDFATIKVNKQDKGIAWGGVHFQYFEDMSMVTSHTTNISLEKKLFVNHDTKKGKTIEPVNGPLAMGDLVTVRIVLRVDRDMEYVHMKDLRGSGMEPINVLSQYKYQDGLRYYESTKDVATHFFIDYLPKGTYVFEYQLRVQLKGRYQCGQAEIQCMYAPEFNSHSGSTWVEVK